MRIKIIFRFYFHEKNCFDSLSQIETKLNAFYSRFVKNDAMTFENLTISKNADTFCFASVFKDSAYTLNANFDVLKSTKVQSDLYPINLKPISIRTYLKNPKALNENPRKSSFLSNFQYD